MAPVPTSSAAATAARPAGPSDGLRVGVEAKKYSAARGGFVVHRHLSFDVPVGHFVTLVGPSGCGKSTLLRMIAGLDCDYVGAIVLNGRRLLAPGRERGIVFQESRLLPWLTVQQNVLFALPARTPRRDRARRLVRALRTVGLRREFRRAWPHQLSGGMAKRVAIARALVNLPDLLLLDEPFSGLDGLTRRVLQSELRRIHDAAGMTTLLVTHDIDEALLLSDTIAVLSNAPASVRCTIDVTPEARRDPGLPAAIALRERLVDALRS